MKILTAFLVAQLLTMAVAAQTYKVTDEGSSVRFKLRNFGIETGGSFSGVEGTISFDPGDVGKASFELSVDAKSVNTDNNMRDNHLRKEEFFDVEQYPRIRFVSVSVKGDGRYTAAGKLTMKGTTKDVTIPFTAVEKGGGYLFSGSFKINRKDYGVSAGGTISKEVTIEFSLLGKKG